MGAITSAPTIATPAPTPLFSSFSSACSYVTGTGQALFKGIQTCTLGLGCSSNVCVSACQNGTLFDISNNKGDATYTTYNTYLTGEAGQLTQGGTPNGATCVAFTSCSNLCNSGSFAQLSAATAVAVTIVAASLTQ